MLKSMGDPHSGQFPESGNPLRIYPQFSHKISVSAGAWLAMKYPKRRYNTFVRRTLFASLLMLAGCGFLIVGCDRGGGSPQSSQANSADTTQPSAPVASAAAQHATEPANSYLVINNHEESFPRAMLRITSTDGKVLARLYSDDPSGVLSGNQNVNTYDFDMALDDISDPADIAQAVWTSKSPSSQRQDTPYGIFLNGPQPQVLQPMDVTVKFWGQAPNVIVSVQGMFWLYSVGDETVAPPPTMVAVFGRLNATVPAK
jgi:hypothetical protein